MKHVIFPSRADAEAASRAEWEARLGRPKRPEDVTEFLHPIEIDDRQRIGLRVEDDTEADQVAAKYGRTATRAFKLPSPE